MNRNQATNQQENITRKDTFLIIQYNVHNSREKVMAPFLLDRDIANIDVVAIQEPWVNTKATNMSTYKIPRSPFDLLFPGDHARVCLLVHRRIDPATWQFKPHDKHLCSVILTNGDQTVQHDMACVAVHNVYIPPRGDPTSTFTELRRRLREPGQHFVCGDFNLHHSMWAGNNLIRPSRHASQLLRLVADHELQLLNKPEVPTHKERLRERATVLDLAWATQGLTNRLIQCTVNETQLEHQSDHYPVTTHFQVNLPDQVTPRKYQWKRMNVELYQATLRSIIPTTQELKITDDVDTLTSQVVTAIQESIEASTPKARYCEWSKPGFDDDCRAVKRTCNRLRRRRMRTRSPEHWREHKAARNEKGRFVKKKLREGFRA